MKIIFLDIDGTMNAGFCHNSCDMGPALSPSHVAALNQLVAESGAHVVISSAMRVGRSVVSLREEFIQAGFLGKVIGKTPSLDKGGRDAEIQEYVNDPFNRVESFVILDDMRNMGSLQHKLVCVYPEGLSARHIPLAVQQLA